MPTFMFRARLHGGRSGRAAQGGWDGARGGGQGRRRESVGGTMIAQYWVMGEDDFIAIAEMPDVESAAALSLAVGASGAASVTHLPAVLGRRGGHRSSIDA